MEKKHFQRTEPDSMRSAPTDHTHEDVCDAAFKPCLKLKVVEDERDVAEQRSIALEGTTRDTRQERFGRKQVTAFLTFWVRLNAKTRHLRIVRIE